MPQNWLNGILFTGHPPCKTPVKLDLPVQCKTSVLHPSLERDFLNSRAPLPFSSMFLWSALPHHQTWVHPGKITLSPLGNCSPTTATNPNSLKLAASVPPGRKSTVWSLVQKERAPHKLYTHRVRINLYSHPCLLATAFCI